MRYMMLVYTQEYARERMSAEEVENVKARHFAVMDEARQKGIFHGAEPLKSTNTATTVRVQDGKTFTTDGPFAETKEQLAGYYILDCKDLDEAIEWASRIPSSCGGAAGCIEIRPLAGLPPR